MSSNRSRCTAAGGVLAVGLGVGAALVATSGVASADPSTDPFSWIGGLDLGAMSAAAPALPLDMQISIDGMDLFPTAGNSATAMSGMDDIAIAIGTASKAIATVGTFDSAFADGNATVASSGKGSFDSATAIGDNSTVDASAGSYDSATVFGPDSIATADFGNGDFASVVNTGSSLTGDVADAGGFGTTVGSNDIAFVVGTSSIADAGADVTVPGNFDLAAVVLGNLLVANAIGGNFMVDILPSL
jgi:hypothetical protein